MSRSRIATARVALAIALLLTTAGPPGPARGDGSPRSNSAAREGRPGRPKARATLLVANKSDDTVAFVDPDLARVDTVIGVGLGPHEIVTSSDGRLAYVSNYGDKDEPGKSISVIDIPARRVISTIALEDPDPLRRPHGLALTRDGRRLYVTVEANRAVLELDLASERVARVLPTEQKVSHMAVLAADESRLYVTNLGSASLTIIRLATGASKRLPMGKGPEGLAVSPDGRSLWVANREDGTVRVLDTETDSSVGTIPVGKVPIRVAFAPNGERVFVTCAESNEIAVIDARQRRLVARIPTGEMPVGILVEPDGRHAWVSQSRRARVTCYDLDTLKPTRHVIPGREPDGLSWVPPAGTPVGDTGR